MKKTMIHLTIADKKFTISKPQLKELFREITINNYQVRNDLIGISDYIATIDNLSFMIFRRNLALEMLKLNKLSAQELFDICFDIVLVSDEIKKLDISTHEHLELSLNIPAILNDLKYKKQYKAFLKKLIKANKQYHNDPQFLLLIYFLCDELKIIYQEQSFLSKIFFNKKSKQDSFSFILRKLGYHFDIAIDIASHTSGQEFFTITKKLIEYGANKELALINAVMNCNLELTDELLRNKANPNITTKDGDHLLDISIDRGEFIIADLLLKYKANPNLYNYNGETPLLKSCKNNNLIIADLLLNNGANPNKTDNSYNTPLIAAINRNNKALIHLLSKYKADWKEIRYLFQPSKQELRRKFIKTLIDNSISENDYLKIIKHNIEYLEQKLVQQSTTEYQLVLKDKDFTNHLTGIVTPDNDIIKQNNTDNHYANELMVSSVLNNDIDNLKKSLDMGADPNFDNPDGLNNTHLIHVITWYGYFAMLELLCKHNINVNTPDANGNTPLYLAAYQNNKQIFTLLINQGADLYFTNHIGVSAYDFIINQDLKEFKEFIKISA